MFLIINLTEDEKNSTDARLANGCSDERMGLYYWFWNMSELGSL